MSSRSGLVNFLLHVVLPLAIIFSIEPFYREPLYKASLSFAADIQKMEELKPFFQAISFMGSGGFYGFMCIVIFNVVSKPAALYIYSGIAFANYTMNQLKSIYGEPRPYWVTNDVKADHCGTGFGNPSGHMLNNCFLWFTLYLHAFGNSASGQRGNQ